MEQVNAKPKICVHEWTYLVIVKTGAIGVRRCTKCGEKTALDKVKLASEREPLKLPA